MKSLHKLNETPADMVTSSFTSEIFQLSNTTTSTSTNSCANKYVLYKHTGLNKLEIQSTNPDNEKLSNVFLIVFNLN